MKLFSGDRVKRQHARSVAYHAHGGALPEGDRHGAERDRFSAFDLGDVVMIALVPLPAEVEFLRHGVKFVFVGPDHVRHVHSAIETKRNQIHVVDEYHRRQRPDPPQ